MKFKATLPLNILLLAGIFISGASAPTLRHDKVIKANALTVYGRSMLGDDGQIELVSSAAHFGFSFTGRSCRVFMSLNPGNSHNYIQYELDGVYQKKIKITGDNPGPVVITSASKGKHTVWIYKATEAHSGPIFVEKIKGSGLSPIKNTDRPIIEFIGNSITCGAAADPSEVACGAGVYHDQHNAYYAYGPRVARALDVNFLMSSVSGIGIYRNWNSHGPAMPEVYETVDFQTGTTRPWNFGNYSPAVVSIALGTNDFSGGDGRHERLPFDSAAFIAAYVKFVCLVRSKYPKTRIALLNSPMLHGANADNLLQYLEAVKEDVDGSYPDDYPVAIFSFSQMHPRGCSGHPSVEDHAILAEEVIPFFRSLLP